MFILGMGSRWPGTWGKLLPHKETMTSNYTQVVSCPSCKWWSEGGERDGYGHTSCRQEPVVLWPCASKPDCWCSSAKHTMTQQLMCFSLGRFIPSINHPEWIRVDPSSITAAPGPKRAGGRVPRLQGHRSLGRPRESIAAFLPKKGGVAWLPGKQWRIYDRYTFLYIQYGAKPPIIYYNIMIATKSGRAYHHVQSVARSLHIEIERLRSPAPATRRRLWTTNTRGFACACCEKWSPSPKVRTARERSQGAPAVLLAIAPSSDLHQPATMSSLKRSRFPVQWNWPPGSAELQGAALQCSWCLFSRGSGELVQLVLHLPATPGLVLLCCLLPSLLGSFFLAQSQPFSRCRAGAPLAWVAMN